MDPKTITRRIVNPNLLKYPTKISRINLDLWYTTGDLHGNPLKLLHFLISVGAVRMPEADYLCYANLYMAYKAPDKDLFDVMKAILTDKMTVVENASVRLIGDVFADRGPDDALTACVTDIFQEKKGILETILSNHDVVLIEMIENCIYCATHSPTDNSVIPFDRALFISSFKTQVNESYFGNGELCESSHASMLGLFASLENNVITPEAFLEQYNRYVKLLKIFSYDYPEELNGEPVFYSHAAMGSRDIYNVGNQLKDHLTDAEYERFNSTSKNKEATAHDLLPLIDACNRVNLQMASANQLCSLLFKEDGFASYLNAFTQNRDDPQDDTFANIHGHDLGTTGNRITLDSCCGRMRTTDGRNFKRHTDSLLNDLTYVTSYKTALKAKAAYAQSMGVQGLLQFGNMNQQHVVRNDNKRQKLK